MNKTTKTAICYSFITLLGGLLYFHIYDFNFTYLDDASIIFDAYKNMTSDPLTVFHIFTKNMFHTSQPQIYYRPVFDGSFILNSFFSWGRLAIYYITNIFLHIIASCLVFKLLTRLGYRHRVSLLLTALFVVSPMVVQTVAWLPGRSDTMVAIFSISSFIAFINFLDTTRFRYYSMHLLFLLLALFSKENALCLIAICLFYMYFVLRRKIFSPGDNFLITGWIIVLAGYLLLRHIAFTDPLKITPGEMLTFIAGNSFVIVQYIGRIFFPSSLSVWPTVQDSQWIPGLVAIIIMGGLLFFSKNIRPKFAVFGFFWFMLFLLPSLVRPSAGVSAVFSNTRVYLPMAGLLIMLAETDMIKKTDIKKWSHAIIVSSVLIFYSLVALNHSYDFMNSSAFWANARRTSPHSWIDPANIKDD